MGRRGTRVGELSFGLALCQSLILGLAVLALATLGLKKPWLALKRLIVCPLFLDWVRHQRRPDGHLLQHLPRRPNFSAIDASMPSSAVVARPRATSVDRTKPYKNLHVGKSLHAGNNPPLPGRIALGSPLLRLPLWLALHRCPGFGHGRCLIGQLELGPRGVVLHIVCAIEGARQRLPVIHPLTSGDSQNSEHGHRGQATRESECRPMVRAGGHGRLGLANE